MQFICVTEIYADRPLLPWQRKLGNFNTKLAKIRDRNVSVAPNRGL